MKKLLSVVILSLMATSSYAIESVSVKAGMVGDISSRDEKCQTRVVPGISSYYTVKGQLSITLNDGKLIHRNFAYELRRETALKTEYCVEASKTLIATRANYVNKFIAPFLKSKSKVFYDEANGKCFSNELNLVVEEDGEITSEVLSKLIVKCP